MFKHTKPISIFRMPDLPRYPNSTPSAEDQDRCTSGLKVILLADDDDDDRVLTSDALLLSKLECDLKCVSDGEELMDYLYRREKYGSTAASPRPDLILLDLNMPRKGGLEALRQIKADPGLRSIPVMIQSTSGSEADIERAYSLGANSYIVKPVTFAGLASLTKAAVEYWFQIVKLPSRLSKTQ